MSLRGSATVVLLLLAILPGCQTFDRPILPAAHAAEPDETLAPLARAIAADTWRENADWTPLAELSGAPACDGRTSKHRWSHPGLTKFLDEARAARKISAPARQPTAETNAAEAASATDVREQLNSVFAQLIHNDDLTGWNAAILWAYADPAAAFPAEKILARLVEHPPSYRTEPSGDTGGVSASLQSAVEGAKAPKPSSRPTASLMLISTNMQAAAAEAWCRVLAASPVDPEEALQPAGTALLNKRLPRKTHDELLRWIALRVRPDRIPDLPAALDDPSRMARQSPAAVDSRRAALDACVIHAVHHRPAPSPEDSSRGISGAPDAHDAEALTAGLPEDAPWPPGVWTLRYEDDPRVRKRFAELVTLIRHPSALAILKAQLRDQESHVRDTAFAMLGVLGSRTARDELEQQVQRPEEMTRIAAVRGLSCFGPEALIGAMSDKSAKVRVEVARSLGRFPSSAAARQLGELLADPSLEVQAAVVAAAEQWPDRLACPLWLQSLVSSAFRVRQSALVQLEDRQGVRLSFPLQGGVSERAERVRALSRDWNIPDAALQRIHELATRDTAAPDAQRDYELRERLLLIANSNADLRVQLEEWLRDLSPADVPALERVLGSVEPAPAELLRHDILPRLSAAHAALESLANADVPTRRKGAQQLAKLGSESSLSPAVVRRMAELSKLEQDGLVWRGVMRSVQADGSDEAAQVALLAINSSWPDIRVLGCEYVGRHGQREQALWLVPLFEDAARSVQVAAVTAAGQCRNPAVIDGFKSENGQPGRKGLRALLQEQQGQLRYAAIVALTRLGDSAAMEELTRMAFDANATGRLEVVQIMGDCGQTRFVETLVRLAWTESHHHVRQAALASLEKLVPLSDRPNRLAEANSPGKAVEIWADWWEDRKRPRG